MIYVIIAIILFLIETEYNYRVNFYNLEDIDKFEDKINFVVQKNRRDLNSDYVFKRANFRWKHSNSRHLFPKYKLVKIRRELFVHHCLQIFGEEKLIDMIDKKKSDLVKKYGNDIDTDLEVFNILIDYFQIDEFKKFKKKSN